MLLALTTNDDGGAFLTTQSTHLCLILSLILHFVWHEIRDGALQGKKKRRSFKSYYAEGEKTEVQVFMIHILCTMCRTALCTACMCFSFSSLLGLLVDYG